MATSNKQKENHLKIIQYTEGMIITPPCIIAGMPNSDYHAHESISKSGLDLFNRSPAHYHFAEPREPTRAVAIGTAIHAAILEPEVFANDYMLLESVTDRRASAYKEAVKIYGVDNVLTATESANVKGMQEMALANPDYQKYASSEHSTELSFFGICSITGLTLRCRFDLLTHDGRALDVKKTRDSQEYDFARSILNYRYHVQHAFYSHVYKCVTGNEIESFEFFAIGENSPHANVVYCLDDESVAIGRKEMMDNLQHLASEHDKTEGIWGARTIISLPEWYLNNAAEAAFEAEDEL